MDTQIIWTLLCVSLMSMLTRFCCSYLIKIFLFFFLLFIFLSKMFFLSNFFVEKPFFYIMNRNAGLCMYNEWKIEVNDQWKVLLNLSFNGAKTLSLHEQ